MGETTPFPQPLRDLLRVPVTVLRGTRYVLALDLYWIRCGCFLLEFQNAVSFSPERTINAFGRAVRVNSPGTNVNRLGRCSGFGLESSSRHGNSIRVRAHGFIG